MPATTPLRLPVLALLALIVLGSAPTLPPEAAPELQARLLLQALAFDRNVAERKADGYVLLLVHAPVGAAREAAELARAFREEAAERQPQLGLRVVTHPWGRIAPFEERLDRLGVDAIYLHRSAVAELEPILRAARSRELPTLAGVAELADRGVSLAVVGLDDPSLGINRAAARLEGLDLPSSLLEVAQPRGE